MIKLHQDFYILIRRKNLKLKLGRQNSVLQKTIGRKGVSNIRAQGKVLPFREEAGLKSRARSTQ